MPDQIGNLAFFKVWQPSGTEVCSWSFKFKKEQHRKRRERERKVAALQKKLIVFRSHDDFFEIPEKIKLPLKFNQSLTERKRESFSSVAFLISDSF